MEIKATGLPETIEDYQVALNAAFAGGKAFGSALANAGEPQRTWVGLTDEDIQEVRDSCGITHHAIKTIEAKLKEKNT